LNNQIFGKEQMDSPALATLVTLSDIAMNATSAHLETRIADHA
jgi:hypothetical protein